MRHDPCEKLDQLIRCPDSDARNFDPSAGIGQTRQTVTAFLRKTNVELCCIFKPSEPGTTAVMGASLLRRSYNLAPRWSNASLGSVQNTNKGCIQMSRLYQTYRLVDFALRANTLEE